jgi:ABC-type polysaccharide/polyol phosphate export permease
MSGTFKKSSLLVPLWQQHNLLWALMQRKIQNRYSGSAAGAFWALLHPLALLALYAVVFEAVFRVKVTHLSLGQPYVLFIALSLWPWMAFQEGVMRGTMAVQNNAALVKKVAFQHELLVYSAVLGSFLVHGFGFAVVLCVLGVAGFSIHWDGLMMTLILMPALLLLALALGLILGALQVFLRDVEQLLSQAMSVLFYATPILFPMTMVPDWLSNIMKINPLMHITEPMRNAMLGQGATDWQGVVWVWLGALLALGLGRIFFLRLSPYFEDMV